MDRAALRWRPGGAAVSGRSRLSVEDVFFARELWRRGAHDFDVCAALDRNDLHSVRRMLTGKSYRNVPFAVSAEERKARKP